MSTNTELQGRPAEDVSQGSKEGGLSLLKEKFLLYSIIFLGIFILGKVASRAAYSTLWTQEIRNMISFTMLLLLFCAGIFNSELVYLIFLLYVPFIDIIPGRFGGQYKALNLFNVLLFIVVLCWFIDKVKKNRVFIVLSQATIPALLFIFFSLLSYVVNGSGYGAEYLISQIFNLKRWVDPVLLFLITSGMTYRRDLRRDALVAVLLGTVMVMFLTVKDVSQITHFSYERRVSLGEGSQPNMLGAFIVDYSFMLLGILLVNVRKKIYWLITLPFWWGIRGIAVTFSRGAYMAFVATMLVISLVRSRLVFFIVIAVLLFVATNLWVLPLAMRERIEMTVSAESPLYSGDVLLESSATGRLDAWKATFELIKNKPLLGHGIGMVGSYLNYYTDIIIGDVHNSFFLLAAEFGLVTLSIFLLTLFTGLRVGWFVYIRSKDEIIKGAALGFFAGIFGIIVNCFFGSHMTTTWEIGYFWVLLAIFANEKKEIINAQTAYPQM
jgi:O-antigen ligase